MKRLSLGIVAVVSAVAIAPASAKTVDIGAITVDTGKSYAGILRASNKTDIIKFTLQDSNLLTSYILSFTVGTVTGLNSQLFSGTPGNATLVSSLTAGNMNFAVTAGEYFVRVSAPVVNGQQGYTLGLFASPQAAAAPGPAGFLVFGVGAAALVMQRRRKKAELSAA